MPEIPTLSVVMPAYNERSTIHDALSRVLASPVDSLEIVVVDDVLRAVAPGNQPGTQAPGLDVASQGRGREPCLLSRLAQSHQ